MTTTKRQFFALPDVVYPPDTVCFKVNVPNERNYIAAFYGAILQLAQWYSWQWDEAHTRDQVAAVWMTIFDQLLKGECDIIPRVDGGTVLGDVMSQQIRISPDDSCIIQMWCIDHWEDWYNPTKCVSSGVQQPSNGGGVLGDGQCKEWDVSLQASQKWLLPVPVSGGFVVTISGLDGAWSDGSLQWKCPDGTGYVLGICGGVPSFVGTDPLGTASHMALIAGFNTTTPVYNLAAGSTIVIPSGVTNQDMWFQANDNTLSDNNGAISFHVKVCGAAIPSGNAATDFTSTDGSWAPRTGHNTTYSAGNGFIQGCDQPGLDTYSQAVIQINIVNASHITAVEVTFDRVYAGFNDGALGAYAAKNFTEGGGGVAIGTDSSMASGTNTVLTFNTNPVDVVPGDYITVAVVDGYLHNRGNCASLGGGSVTIKEVRLFYTGSSPV